jgi:ssRNA-specific RNase YbeY (16S rRNA maturation enzyme)
MSNVDVIIRPEARPFLAASPSRQLGTRLRAALRLLDRSRCSFTLLLTCDEEIRSLNRHYRKLDRATDVLSFHQQELAGEADPASDGVFLGDIVISVETALRRSGKGRLSWRTCPPSHPRPLPPFRPRPSPRGRGKDHACAGTATVAQNVRPTRSAGGQFSVRASAPSCCPTGA